MAEYTYFVNNVNNQAYVFSGIDASNPTLTFNTGDVVTFNVIADGHPLWIKTQPSTGTANQYNDGVTNNGTDNGTITFIIPENAPSTLYYNCQFHGIMFGIINIIPATTTTTSTTTSSTSTTSTTTSTTSTSTSTTTRTTATTGTTPVPLSTTTTTTTTTTLLPLPSFYDVAALQTLTNVAISWKIENANMVEYYDLSFRLIDSDATANISINNPSEIFNPQTNLFSTNIPISYLYKDNQTYAITIYAGLSDGRVSQYTFNFFKQVATTTTTTTTTDSPLPSIIDTEDLSDCPCGEVNLPLGSFYKDKPIIPFILPNTVLGHLSTLIISENDQYEAQLLHSTPVKIAKENKFITCTNLINEHIIGKKLAIFVDSNIFQRLIIENVIKIVVKEFNTKKILGIRTVGGFNSKTKIRSSDVIDKPSIVVNLGGDFDLFDNALIIEFISLCEYNNQPCCDSLPTDIQTFGPSVICIPLEDYYTQEEINPITTTTSPPDSIIFTQPLQANVVDGKIQLTAKITTYYNSNYTYWFELLTSDCAIRISDYLQGTPNELVTFTETRYGSMSYRILVVSPTVAYSNTAFINYTTTTTTIPPDPEVTTSYTTAPPPPVPFNVQASFNLNSRIWSLSWDVSNTIGLTDYVIQYRRSGTSTWITYNDDISTARNIDLSFVTIDCDLYQFRIAAKRGDAIGPFSAIAYAYSAIAPTMPSNLTSNKVGSQIIASWQAPSSNGNCENTTYIVQYKASNENDWTVYNENYEQLSIAIDIENTSLEYYVRIAAKNIAGISNFTSVPSQPFNLSISVIE